MVRVHVGLHKFELLGSPVIAFVKVNRLNKEIESIHSIYSGEFERVNRDRTESERQIFSVMDSRLDKLESKITSRKA